MYDNILQLYDSFSINTFYQSLEMLQFPLNYNNLDIQERVILPYIVTNIDIFIVDERQRRTNRLISNIIHQKQQNIQSVQRF